MQAWRRVPGLASSLSCLALAWPPCSAGGVSLRVMGTDLDRREGSHRLVSHRLTDEERQRILLTCNQPGFAGLPLGHIVPVLADRGVYAGSERSFFRALHAHGQTHRHADGPVHHRSPGRCRG